MGLISGSLTDNSAGAFAVDNEKTTSFNSGRLGDVARSFGHAAADCVKPEIRSCGRFYVSFACSWWRGIKNGMVGTERKEGWLGLQSCGVEKWVT